MATSIQQSSLAFGSLPWFRSMIEKGSNERLQFFVTITPHIAEQLLLLNTNNRHFKQHALEQYRRAMRLGFWRGLNGESIKIKRDGSLGDGQHRLRAIVDEGISVETSIVFGVDDADIATVDQGKARTAADVDRMSGGEMSEIVAAAARKILAYEASGKSSPGATGRISNSEVNDRLWKDDAVREAGKWAASHRCPGLPGSSLAFIRYVLSAVHRDAAEEYLTQISKGIGLSLKDPATAVRDYLINPSGARKKTPGQRIEAVLRGWNAYRQSKSLSKVITTGTFPELV